MPRSGIIVLVVVVGLAVWLSLAYVPLLLLSNPYGPEFRGTITDIRPYPYGNQTLVQVTIALNDGRVVTSITDRCNAQVGNSIIVRQNKGGGWTIFSGC